MGLIGIWEIWLLGIGLGFWVSEVRGLGFACLVWVGWGVLDFGVWGNNWVLEQWWEWCLDIEELGNDCGFMVRSPEAGFDGAAAKIEYQDDDHSRVVVESNMRDDGDCRM